MSLRDVVEIFVATVVDTVNGFTDSKTPVLFTISPITVVVVVTASGIIVGAKLLLLVIALFILLFVVDKLYSIVSFVVTINRIFKEN